MLHSTLVVTEEGSKISAQTCFPFVVSVTPQARDSKSTIARPRPWVSVGAALGQAFGAVAYRQSDVVAVDDHDDGCLTGAGVDGVGQQFGDDQAGVIDGTGGCVGSEDRAESVDDEVSNRSCGDVVGIVDVDGGVAHGIPLRCADLVSRRGAVV